MRRAIGAGLIPVLAALAACASGSPATAPAAPITLERAQRLVDAPDRSQADRTTDLRRKPAQLLAFIGVTPGIKAFDVSTGGGYTTELLARAIGSAGIVYGQSQPRDPNQAMSRPAVPEGGSAAAPAPAASAPAEPRRSSADALAERERHLIEAKVDAAPIVYVGARFDDPIPAALTPDQLDLVTLILNYHDFGFMGVDRARMNRAIFAALKPGGLYVIADNAGRPGTGITESGTLHQIEESFLRAEVEAAGFKLVEEGDFLHNPNDLRDQNVPNPPQPKDQFVLKFVKPAA